MVFTVAAVPVATLSGLTLGAPPTTLNSPLHKFANPQVQERK